MKWLERFADDAYALLRIVAGFMFLFHGLQKILGVFAVEQPPAWSQLWFGGLIELVGGTAIMLGWQTRAAAFLCSGMMAVAYIQFHWKLRFDSMFWPIVNKGELALLYSVTFFYLACRGGVKWALSRRA